MTTATKGRKIDGLFRVLESGSTGYATCGIESPFVVLQSLADGETVIWQSDKMISIIPAGTELAITAHVYGERLRRVTATTGNPKSDRRYGIGLYGLTKPQRTTRRAD
jgi:hypothetical protein